MNHLRGNVLIIAHLSRQDAVIVKFDIRDGNLKRENSRSMYEFH